MKASIDLKMMITLATIVATGAGFYYTTQYRLESLEEETQSLKAQIEVLEKTVKRRTREIRSNE